MSAYLGDEWGGAASRPLRAGEMRKCLRCDGAQLGPGPWGYSGPICYCARPALPMTHFPDGSPVDHVTVPTAPLWWELQRQGWLNQFLNQRQKPRIRVKAGSRRYP